MTRTLLVAPTGHGVGLTATCLGLVHALERQGVSVGFYKPLAQPRARGADQDRSTAPTTARSPSSSTARRTVRSTARERSAGVTAQA